MQEHPPAKANMRTSPLAQDKYVIIPYKDLKVDDNKKIRMVKGVCYS